MEWATYASADKKEDKTFLKIILFNLKDFNVKI